MSRKTNVSEINIWKEKISKQDTEAKKNATAKSALHVLIAEDIPTNVKILQKMLEKKGYKVTVALNGEEAVTKMKAALKGELAKIDIILTDIEMPKMNGDEAAKEIRKIEEKARSPRVPIIAISSIASMAGQEIVKEGFIDAFSQKPYNSDEIYTLINKYTLKIEPQSPPTPLQFGTSLYNSDSPSFLKFPSPEITEPTTTEKNILSRNASCTLSFRRKSIPDSSIIGQGPVSICTI